MNGARQGRKIFGMSLNDEGAAIMPCLLVGFQYCIKY